MQMRSSISQFNGAASAEGTPAASGWKPGKIAGQVAGKIGSIFGFKASIASSQQHSDHVEQNNATQKEIESRIIGIDKHLQSLPSKASIQASDPLMRQLQQESLHNTKITLGQEKGRLLEQLANKNYRLPTNSSKTSAPPGSSSPVTVARTPSPTTGSRDPKQVALQQYQSDKKQIAANQRLMDQPGGIFSAAQKSAIAQDTWNRQQKTEEYEQKHPEVLQNNS